MGEVVQSQDSEAVSEDIEWTEVLPGIRFAVARDGSYLEAFSLAPGSETPICGWRVLHPEGPVRREYKGPAESLDAAQQIAETTYWGVTAAE